MVVVHLTSIYSHRYSHLKQIECGLFKGITEQLSSFTRSSSTSGSMQYQQDLQHLQCHQYQKIMITLQRKNLRKTTIRPGYLKRDYTMNGPKEQLSCQQSRYSEGVDGKKIKDRRCLSEYYVVNICESRSGMHSK